MCSFRTAFLIVLCVVVIVVDSAKIRHHSIGKQGLKFIKNRGGIGTNFGQGNTNSNAGLWPSVFNVATKALITANATCGEGGREEFCRMSEGARGRCGICDNFSPDPGKRHPVHYAIDGTNKWWQSPALHYGPEYEFVTITLDLKQVYQVAYIIIKAANSPRPGSWILERSLDGESYDAWQYFAANDKECIEKYNTPATKGKPHYSTDTEVICTSFYSRLTPMENGEIHTSLVHGRPGANETSPELLEFTKARYVRLRFQGFRGSIEPIPRWLTQDISKDKRLFYSIRDISIGGQCVCNGHAANCRHNVASGHPECECAHHTCGSNCDRCCPLYNQRSWGAGSSRDSRECLSCNCHGHAKSCHYDEATDSAGLSLDANGNYQGGGVCEDCTSYTTGINCERCIRGYYRPYGTAPDAEIPCVKCSCDPLGSSGICTGEAEGPLCECRPGYGGALCDACTPGYRGYPNCEKCPCDERGVVLNDDCEEKCACKVNVEGLFCDRCKSGHFALRKSNDEGCYPCFCSGVTTLCEATAVIQRKFETLNDWYVSDISTTYIEKPTPDEREMLSIGNYEIPGIESYYWLAPKLYLGNKLEAYGSNFTFKVHWVVMRGDTSGKPTTGPNLILVGANGLRIANGNDFYTGPNMTFTINLVEAGWYHVRKDVKDIITRLRRDDYQGDPVNRSQFLRVLTDVKYVMLRAKFHTDQIEASLEQASWKIGEDGYGSVERCSCPSGYTGLSCETCDYGYVRVTANTTDHHEQGFCVKCDCNGHSKTCDLDTGQCSCEHDTIGETCNRCAPGFYGNALMGTSHDCRKCACPLMEEENNFSPSCQLDSLSLSNDDDEPGYVCTQCPKGYTGDHCEICDDGYFGLPTKSGGSCQPCSCSGNPCDRITGQCLGCKGNTEGWRCERCKSGYFGDPKTSNCQACLCDPVGSESDECNNTTGQCMCKKRVIGRTCDRCMDRFGNMTASCTPCDCDVVGSKSDICEPRTGLCDCQPGIEGFHCDACQHLHFGFAESGCQSCNCNPKGSEFSTCDIKTGNCRCKTHYIGRTCDQCEGGYWESETGCVKCQCDPDGSSSISCDRYTGRCNCKTGVGGERCDNCLPEHYNFTNTGCMKCKECKKPNHICDPDTGDCVCPRLSCGTKCSKCCPYSWNYKPFTGCQPCFCSQEGSTSQQCDVTIGSCHCRLGYAGDKCNRCAHGYYGYPKCRRCNCNLSGTDRDKARCDAKGVCQCLDDGSCLCKQHVQNRNCNECKEGTFGLHVDNPSGCTSCFCFGRSTKCKDAQLTWGQIRTNSSRELNVSNTPSGRMVISLDTIDGRYGNVTANQAALEEWRRINAPLYWRLHEIFKGDRILSYSGYIRFMTETFGANYPPQRSERYPLVKLFGNGFELHHYPSMPPPIGRHEVRFHESLWKDGSSGSRKVHRDVLMMVLQNVTDIHVKATDSSNFNRLIIHEVTLDTAIEVKGTPPPLATGVEICECPPQYNSSSCQDPSTGYYRNRSKSSPNMFDTIVGKAEACRCNGRSKICDIESGRCLNCANNTSGHHCEKCAEGFYGNPMLPYSSCKPCPCPSTEHNFAIGCSPGKLFKCYCKPGYVGPKCNKCAIGYYGNPSEEGGSCKPCNCNKDGILTKTCNPKTGQCDCKRGIIGRQCSKCEKPRHILENNACTPCDDCTQRLLDQIDQLSNWLQGNTSHLMDGKIEPPWQKLSYMEDKFMKQHDRYKKYDENVKNAKKLIEKAALEDQQNRLKKLDKSFQKAKTELNAVQKKANDMTKNAEETLAEMDEVKTNVQTLMEMLNHFGKSHVTIKEAVKEGSQLLKSMQKQSDAIKKSQRHKNALKKCQEINDYLEDVNSKSLLGKAINLEKDLEKINKFIGDLEKILMDVDGKLSETKMKNLSNEARIKSLAEKIEKLKTDVKTMAKQIEDKNKILNETSSILNATAKTLDALKSDDEFKTSLKKLKTQTKHLDENLPILEKDFAKVTDHASQLNKNITKYMKMLSLDEKELSAVNASKAYSNLIELLEEAKIAADEADEQLRIAKDVIAPKDMDSIYVNATICDYDSKRLETRINMIKNKIPDFDEKAMALQLKMVKLNNENWDNGMNNSMHSKRLQEIKDELSNEIDAKKLIREAIDHSEKMKNVYRKAMEISISTQYDLARTFQKHLNLTSQEKIKMLRDQIKLTKELLQNTFVNNQTNLDIIKNHNRNFSNFYVQNASIAVKLNELRAKIQKSKEIADGIRVSLSGSNCSRSYKLNDLEPTLITNLSVTFEYKNPKVPTSLFYLSNDKKQYMNLKVADGIISFLVLLDAKGPIELSHKRKLEESNSYTVNIERISNRIKMQVNNIVESAEIGSTVFKTNPFDLIKVGDAPDNRGLPGCVREVIFNRRTIGFWNFETSTGTCSGCVRNNTNNVFEANPNSIFNGGGYSLIHQQRQNKSVKPDQIRVSFGLRTFDEDALLFLAPHPDGGTYMAITLNQGRIMFTMHYKNNKDVILKSKEKFNNGKLVNVEVEKYYNKKSKTDEVILTLNDVTLKEERNVHTKEILKVKQVNYYFGGVPPDFLLNSKDATWTLNTHQSLLGIISNCDADQPFTLHETTKNQQHYGVEKSDRELEFRKVWFEGEGHLSMEMKKNSPIHSIAFLVRTNQSMAFVMDVENVAKFNIRNGKIIANVIHKKKTLNLTSSSVVNDDDYHLIELIFKSNLTLNIDGLEEDVQKVKFPKIASADEEQIIQMGGLNTEEKFNGEISDIIINDRLIKFTTETVQNFVKAKIGRGVPTKKKRPASEQKDENENLRRVTSDNIKDMQRTEGCDMAVNPYVLETNAVKFGDRPESYVKYDWKESLWRNDFKLEFEFRTFYKTGMLLFAQGEKEHYNLLDVRDGKIFMIVAGRRKKIFTPSKNVDDGEWHRISIEIKTNKKKRKLAVIVDERKEKAKKIPMNRLSGDVFLGGVPKDVFYKMPKNSKLQPFKGCVRGLKLNGELQSFQNHHNINVCFPKIEKGSYFNGDAYAIYDRSFRVKEHLELNFEFRTAEQNGILLSVSTPNNNPALSVELQNGAVVMSVDMGNGIVSNVTNYLSEYALCNNRWHNVTALFSSELTVNVDGVSKSWVISEGGYMDDIDDPLYIGGLPDAAPEGTLKTRENFKGCIRNVKIGDKTTDWIDMAELNNVSLNSCPVA